MSTQFRAPRPSAVPRPKLPNAAEIDRQLRENMPGLRVYNPSQEWLTVEMYGLFYYLRPDLGGAIEAHPVTGEPVRCDGKTELQGRYPQLNGRDQLDSSGKKIDGQDAPSMVKFITGPEQAGQQGVVWLPGRSAEEDAQLMEAGKSVYLDFQFKKDDDIIARRQEFKANWEKNPAHRGQPVPPPTRYENEAMERVQLRKRRAEYRFNCVDPTCIGYAANEWTKFEEHMRLAHNKAGLRPEMFEASTGMVVTDKVATEAQRKAIADANRAVPVPTDEDRAGAEAAEDVEPESDRPEPRGLASAVEDAPEPEPSDYASDKPHPRPERQSKRR